MTPWPPERRVSEISVLLEDAAVEAARAPSVPVYHVEPEPSSLAPSVPPSAATITPPAVASRAWSRVFAGAALVALVVLAVAGVLAYRVHAPLDVAMRSQALAPPGIDSASAPAPAPVPSASVAPSTSSSSSSSRVKPSPQRRAR